jgi:hypothetical protein
MSLGPLQPLLNVSYWFDYYPSAFQGTAYWVVLGVSASAVVVGVLLAACARLVKDAGWRRVAVRTGKLLLTVGLLNLISFFFTQTYTPLLGSRFWFVLWLLIAIVWFWYIVRYALRVAPKERAERAKQQEYLKYLPH